jgi:hypothetical protein
LEDALGIICTALDQLVPRHTVVEEGTCNENRMMSIPQTKLFEAQIQLGQLWAIIETQLQLTKTT